MISLISGHGALCFLYVDFWLQPSRAEHTASDFGLVFYNNNVLEKRVVRRNVQYTFLIAISSRESRLKFLIVKTLANLKFRIAKTSNRLS